MQPGLGWLLCALAAGTLPMADAAAQEAPPRWQGFYAGGVLGYSWTDVDIAAPPEFFSSSYGGVSGGPLAGWNQLLPNSLLVGLEAEIVFADLLDDRSTSRYKASLVGRIGQLVTPRTLVFGIFGVAFAQYTVDVGVTQTNTMFIDDNEVQFTINNTTTFSIKDSEVLQGWTLGGGFESQRVWFDHPVRIGAEYRYTDFETWRFSDQGQTFAIEPEVQEVRLRLVIPIANAGP